MTIHVLVEGPSERALFERWMPRLIPGQDFRVHPHQGKGTLPRVVSAAPESRARGLLDQLPAKLRGFSASLNPNADGVFVLLDADDEDIQLLSASIAEVARLCAPQLRVGIGIAVEETEAFYLGDLRALMIAYPAADLARARAYVPDDICGTWELFGQIVNDDGGNKVQWAEAIGPHLTTIPAQNRSPSFRRAVKEIRALAEPVAVVEKKRAYRHLAKTLKRPKPKR